MKKTKITCLPIAGIGNPYQKLMMDGLMSSGLVVQHGQPGKFFAFTRSAIKNKPNYIHVDWLHSYYLRRAHWMTWLLYPVFILDVLFAKYVFGTRFAWTLHNIFPHDRPQSGPYKWARTWFARHCEWIRVFDEGTVTRATISLKVPEHKFRVIPEGSYVGYYTNKVDKSEAKKLLKLPENKRILLYLGLIKPYKGILTLVKSFQACAINEDAILLIAGKAMSLSYLQTLKQAIKSDNIYLKEQFVADDMLQVYFNAADVVVLPFQRIENSGSAILAMGFAKPIVAPAKGVLISRLSQQRNLLYHTASIQSTVLSEVLQLTDEVLLDIGKANLSAVQQYDWEDFANCFN